MRKGYRLLGFSLLLLVIGALILIYRDRGPTTETHTVALSDGSPALMTTTAAPSTALILALPHRQWLAAAALNTLAEAHHTQIMQIEFSENDCSVQQQRLQLASKVLGDQPLIVAGMGPGAAMAWRWLAGQSNSRAQAVSIDFNLQKPDCSQPLPDHGAQGQWHVAWNNNPDDSSAAFARRQTNSHTQISDYAVTLPQLLNQQLQSVLAGQAEAMPTIEVAADKPNASVSLFYSGDGGWRDLDRDVAAQMAQRGYPVVGVDALRYFWQHKSPEQGAKDLSQLMQQYRQKWGAKRFVLIGFSFGADTLPAFYNRLPVEDQQQVDAIILLASARSGSFEIEVQGWLGTAGTEAETGPELLKLPAAKVLCVYGVEEAATSGCTLPGLPGEVVKLPGGHHYDGNYPALAERLIAAIKQR
ncbi:virulence factor family protein [Pseudomonas sp. EL_65y_Pfl2_R95]|uniref:virulence factor family protein n=1 Tax=Pseudomonas sp. EL_65y_Pfl2_R95 TaxID=3088698 RepID=UPI0030DD073A